jgi:hypothetical protein
MLGKDFPELDQLLSRIKELSKDVITGDILMDEMEVIFTQGLSNNRQDSSFSTNEKILGIFKDCDCQPDILQLEKSGQELAILRSDLANIHLLLPLHHFHFSSRFPLPCRP